MAARSLDIVFVILQVIEKAEQLISGLIASQSAIGWRCLCKSLLLHLHGCLQIYLRRFDRLMAQP